MIPMTDRTCPLTYAERIAVWRQGNPHERLTFDLLLEICDATDLTGADLTGANLWRANLRYADLTDANLRYADLTGADLRGASLSGANLWRARWDGLQITGLPSGQIVLTPTPVGWELRVGCWVGAIDRLRTIITQDDDWPEAEGDEITRRRPGLQAALALIDAHIALRPNVINELKTKWATE